MAKIRLTENKLKQIVVESVKKVLTELDWRTYASAAQKEMQRGGKRGNSFKQAATNAFNRQNGYGLTNVPYGDGDDKNLSHNGNNQAYAGELMYAPHGMEFNTYSGTVDKNGNVTNNSNQRVAAGQTSNMSKPKYNKGEVLPNDVNSKTTFNPKMKFKQMAGDKQVRDFYQGKSQYTKGKGWN